MKPIIMIVMCVLLMTGCTVQKETKDIEMMELEVVQESDGSGQALHGSYNADKSAQVASMYIGGYPNMCYYRVGGDTCYTQFLNDVAHANGGRAGWLEGITIPLG